MRGRFRILSAVEIQASLHLFNVLLRFPKLERLVRHLQSVEESYFEHMLHALSFAVALFFAAVFCLLHAFLPFLFEKSGSSIVSKLHDRMVVNRARLSAAARRREATRQFAAPEGTVSES